MIIRTMAWNIFYVIIPCAEEEMTFAKKIYSQKSYKSFVAKQHMVIVKRNSY